MKKQYYEYLGIDSTLFIPILLNKKALTISHQGF
jgi:hypothetical protein